MHRIDQGKFLIASSFFTLVSIPLETMLWFRERRRKPVVAPKAAMVESSTVSTAEKNGDVSPLAEKMGEGSPGVNEAASSVPTAERHAAPVTVEKKDEISPVIEKDGDDSVAGQSTTSPV